MDTQGMSTPPIWLDEVNCNGDEKGLDQCNHNPWGEHDCSHSEDVILACCESSDTLNDETQKGYQISSCETLGLHSSVCS